jgi:hypothetical protein
VLARAPAAHACRRSPGARTRRRRGARPTTPWRPADGTFQNLRLLAATTAHLERHGFRVLTHRRVPPNDGGISFGQAAIAAASTAR